MDTRDYSTITELPLTKVTKEQLERAHQRYVFASNYTNNGDVLEIGCGGGQGLGILVESSKSVTGCDINESNIHICNSTYKDNKKVKIEKLDAEALDSNNNYDLIVLFETIYYLHNIELFLENIFKMLKSGGNLIISTANKDWPEFNPSPYSTKYFSVPELYNLTKSIGFKVQMYASFPDRKNSIKAKMISLIKRTAVKLNLMPKTMRGKVIYKRIFMGNLMEYPSMLRKNMFKYEMPAIISGQQKDDIHTAIFALCKKT